MLPQVAANIVVWVLAFLLGVAIVVALNERRRRIKVVGLLETERTASEEMMIERGTLLNEVEQLRNRLS